MVRHMDRNLIDPAKLFYRVRQLLVCLGRIACLVGHLSGTDCRQRQPYQY